MIICSTQLALTILIAESYPMSSAASIEILTPVIDLSDDDGGGDDHRLIRETKPSRFCRPRRSGLFIRFPVTRFFARHTHTRMVLAEHVTEVLNKKIRKLRCSLSLSPHAFVALP